MFAVVSAKHLIPYSPCMYQITYHRFRMHHGTMFNKQQLIMNGQVDRSPIPHQPSKIDIELSQPLVIGEQRKTNRPLSHDRLETSAGYSM